ncbi:LysM peptidoglycan-binding domain-containing protein [Marinoscillum furvescens]|nr:LysM peptidoglycan-binding domain-containing protein [Marinoscillum furvescens]
MIAQASAHVGDSVRLQKDGKRYFVIHQVEKGETLYSLSKRYGSELQQIASVNSIEDNQIALGQVIRVPVEVSEEEPGVFSEATAEPKPEEVRGKHTSHMVSAGETLFSISQKYGVAVGDLKSWNALTSNELSIGQVLKVVPKNEQPQPTEAEEPAEEVNNESGKTVSGELPAGFTAYYVQSGDLLETIAKRFKVRPDSIVIWNQLDNTYLTIGQKLLIKGKLDEELMRTADKVEQLAYGTRKKVKDQSGFVKVYEEGTARKIEGVAETQKYLALHRQLKVGTLMEVRNLMNNQKIFVRVVGKLPDTGLNENVLIRLTPICFDRLGVIDPKTRVEVSYYEE